MEELLSSKFDIIESLGNGAYGTVKLVKNKETGSVSL
jgi:hypothetical protein